MRPAQRLAPLAIALLVAACNFAEKKAPTAPKLVTPSEAEAQKFAESFVAAVQSTDVVGASALVDWDVLLARATADTYASPQFRAAFVKGAKQTTQRSAYAMQLSSMAAQGAKISLLRVRGDDGGRSALIRILPPDGGVTYNEMLLTTNDEGEVRAADVYVYATGEYMSDTMRRMYKFAVAGEPTFIERLKRKKNPILKIANQYKEMSDLVSSGQHDKAVRLFKQMPPELKKEKSVLVGYVTASANLDEAQYESAIEELRKAFPNDTGMDLMLIDGYIIKQKYDDAIAAIDRLDKDLNGDPYLDVLRANILSVKGDAYAADRFARRAVEREPALAAAFQ